MKWMNLFGWSTVSNKAVSAFYWFKLPAWLTAKRTVVFIGFAMLGLAAVLGGCRQPAEAWSIERVEIRKQLKYFVAEKKSQAKAAFKAEGKPLLPEYEAIFDAAEKGDWLAISNVFEGLRPRAPQFEGPEPRDDRLRGTGWHTVVETWGAFDNIVMGGEKLIAFGEDAISSIPPGSIYFGGTDPGRFVITALQKSHVIGEPFFYPYPERSR